MSAEYSVQTIKQFEKDLRDAGLVRPIRIERYEPGAELVYDVKGVSDANEARVRLVVDKFVGGGFAGQVYRVNILDIEANPGETIEGLETGKTCAMKILIPPSGFSNLFRNALYWIGFQGPFQLQVNPIAARAGALWQKFFRRGAKSRFGSEKAVVDIYATFIDGTLGSCGELSEWVDGRTWRLEVDDRMDLLKLWAKGSEVDTDNLGSPEYRTKHEFMHEFVELIHDMGGHEFARQYEWSTCKSQPNCLKRSDQESDPSAGLTAVDFRAGLALLPFLPMSPGDFALIGNGIKRGSLVQFDRGDVEKLERFVDEHNEDFSEMRHMLDELKTDEKLYRDSLPDITHHRTRLFRDRGLWSTILDSAVTGWKIRNTIDDRSEARLRQNRVLTLLFYLLGIIPLLGSFVRKLWGRPDWRSHYGKVLSDLDYLQRAVRAKVTEKAIGWHRDGRMDSEHAEQTVRGLWRFTYHLPLSFLPMGLHRFITDRGYAKDKLVYLLVRPVRLYFNAEMREQWLRDMVAEGQENHLLPEEDAATILSQINEPFIQKYLKCLAVHVCTLPVTQIVSVIVAIIYIATHPEMPSAQAWGIGLGIIALFQVIPISPGSLTRGFYVVYLVIRERNFRDYNIAVFLSFFKYIGYLAFPIQMGYRYPTLAQFMAAHWATDAVHVVPVFGERGALLEHSVFCMFYNWPLTIRRRMVRRSELRAEIPPRYWHVGLCALAGVLVFGLADVFYLSDTGQLPTFGEIWWLVLLVPVIAGNVVNRYAGGAELSKRIIGAAVCGVLMGTISGFLTSVLGYTGASGLVTILAISLWRAFLFSILSTASAIVCELKLQ